MHEVKVSLFLPLEFEVFDLKKKFAILFAEAPQLSLRARF